MSETVDLELLNREVVEKSAFIDAILSEVEKVIIGQKGFIERLLMGLLTGGHILVEGIPGLAKTLTIKSLADAVHADFSRIQFTPDLLPADLVGTEIYNQREGTFSVKKGPIFSNITLADEINRSPAKVQSALLEAMQERQVTIGDETFPLADAFLVLATQNPIEQEGTYPLPEAQVDRFMFKLKVGYPSREEEKEIISRNISGKTPAIEKVTTTEDILKAREVVNRIYVDDKIKTYVVNLVFASRYPEECGLSDLKDMIQYGASPRASIFLTRAAMANAFMKHRGFVTPEDVKTVAMDILRHRIILSYEAEAEEVSTEDIIRKIFDAVEVP
ncbi:MAG: MoxR family ATPase [Proteobacteria bacterium]|nr:MoxR family ATPase [Pseudomonadota bacterium]